MKTNTLQRRPNLDARRLHSAFGIQHSTFSSPHSAFGIRHSAFRHAFTLTEVLISLAMVSILLIGISRIFSLTSQTIGTGQALSKTVRLQRSIQQTFSADILGPGDGTNTISGGNVGMMPLNAADGPNSGMPFLTISNFRVATYPDAAARAGDAYAPADVSSLTAAEYATRSAQMRGIDINNDGTKNGLSVTKGGETLPIYAYGVRNFRCDTIGFFTRGDFTSTTAVSDLASGAPTSYASGVRSSESFVWYGHMRVFNGTAGRLDYANAYGAPGDHITQSAPNLPNTNHRYANQFTLGRAQLLLVEPTDHDGRPGTGPATAAQGGEDRKLAENNTPVANDDPSKPAIFIQRNWWEPTGDYITPARPILSPFTINDAVKIFKPDSASSLVGCNKTLYTDDRAEGDSLKKSTVSYQSLGGRTDVIGVDATNARQRARFLQDWDLNPPRTLSSEWWETLLTSWSRRYWCNPFVSTTPFDPGLSNINAKSLSQRQQIIAQGCSQFIVEFAGDFVTQVSDPMKGSYGSVTSALPDGILDFVLLPNGVTTTRWYGLPRDVNGDGVISTQPGTALTSPDVLPVGMYAGLGNVRAANKGNSWLPFERIAYTGRSAGSTPVPLPASGNDYMTNVDEPSGATSPDRSSYVCVWGPNDFERTYTVGPAGATREVHGAVPQMVRFIVDTVDAEGKLRQPVTLEMVYPVPGSK